MAARENLFGIYFITLSRFFKGIKSYKEQDGEQETLRVIYGTPAAAFKAAFDITNGKMDLPVLNFKMMDAKRNGSFENPFARVRGIRLNNNEEITTERAVQKYDLQFNFILWTSSYKTRDDLMAKILRSFEGVGEMYLNYLRDPSDPQNVSWAHFKFEENWQDETDLEGLPEKETRDIIRTGFQITQTNALLEYYGWINNSVQSIQLNEKTLASSSNEDDVNRQYRINILSNPNEDLVFEIDSVYL